MSSPGGPVPVLEVGGSHVVGAIVENPVTDPRVGTVHRRELSVNGSADELLSAFADVADRTGAEPGAVWAAAVPGPFDLATGIAHYADVGKFESLTGVDVAAELARRLRTRPRAISFVGDASAFTIGEWRAGTARGRNRVLGITLGTGVGSGFLAGGRIVTEGGEVPPEGRIDLVRIAGRPLESTVSSRAIRRSLFRTTGAAAPEVREIAARARAGDTVCAAALTTAFDQLGRALAPWVLRFAPDVVVVGGAIARSWDLVAGPLDGGLVAAMPSGAPVPPVERAAVPDTAGLIGAAWHATYDPSPVRVEP